MSLSFEFSAADAQAVPTKKASEVAKNPKLDVSLDELINIEKKEKRDARKQQSKPKTEKRTTKPTRKTEKTTTRRATATTKRTSDRSKDITVKTSSRDSSSNKKKEFRVRLPERVVRDLLKTAGVNTDKYDVSVYAIPRGRD